MGLRPIEDEPTHRLVLGSTPRKHTKPIHYPFKIAASITDDMGIVRSPPFLLLAILSVALGPGCAPREENRQDEAAQVFAAFQDALFRQDSDGLRALLCRDARAVVPTLCAIDLADKEPLVVQGVSKTSYEYRVHVVDPNQGDRESFYVLAVEDGDMRVDLLTTTAYNHETVAGAAGDRKFIPQRLTPEQLAQIKARK